MYISYDVACVVLQNSRQANTLSQTVNFLSLSMLVDITANNIGQMKVISKRGIYPMYIIAGWKWVTYCKANHPTFWVCQEGCKSRCGATLSSYSHCQPCMIENGHTNGDMNGETNTTKYRYTRWTYVHAHFHNSCLLGLSSVVSYFAGIVLCMM